MNNKRTFCPLNVINNKSSAILIRTAMLLAVIPLWFFPACSHQLLTVPAVTDMPSGIYHPGKFVWHDLMTSNVPAVKMFYGELFGWQFSGPDDRKARYTTIMYNNHTIGGIVYVEELKDGGNPSQWMSYLSVENVDEAVDFFRKKNGTILREPWDQAGRGRMAIVQDQQGALLALVRSDVGDPPDTEPVNFSWLWHEYLSTDVSEAMPFYKTLAGSVFESMSVPENYTYYLLKKNAKVRAGMARVPWEGVKPNWLVYIKVEEVAPVVETVKTLGGEVLLPPTRELRKGSVALVADPSGAVFAIQKWPFE